MTWDPQPRARSPEERLGYDIIGRLLARRRHRLGWSQRYLEYRSGIDQPVISRLENGKQFGLRWARFAALVGALGGLGDEPYPRDLPDLPDPRPAALPPAIDLWLGGGGLDPFPGDLGQLDALPGDQGKSDEARTLADADDWHRSDD